MRNHDLFPAIEHSLALDVTVLQWCTVYISCLFFFPEKSYQSLDESAVPEVQRCNMAPVVLQLKALGIDNVLRFHYLSVSIM